eukprot:gene3977-15192_t
MALTSYGIVVIQSLFFALGGIRDQFFVGKVIMPDEEYLQSWWMDTALAESENGGAKMVAVTNAWGAFIGTIALVKIVVALTGGTTPLARTLGLLFAVTNVWVCARMWPMGALMADYHGEGNKGDVTGFIVMLGVEALLWLVSTAPSGEKGKVQ